MATPIRDLKDEQIVSTAVAGDVDCLVTGERDLLVFNGDPSPGRLEIEPVAALSVQLPWLH